MKHRLLSGILAVALCTSLCSCGVSKTGTAMKNITETGEPVRLSVPIDEEGYSQLTTMNALSMQLKDNWTELDQKTTYPNIRRTLDDILNVAKFASNSKNGCIYVDNTGKWTGNSTLFNAFENKIFVNEYWTKKLKESEPAKKIHDACSADYNVNIDNTTYELLLAFDSYYGIFNYGVDKTGGMLDTPIARKDAMAALYKADTPVTYITENKFSDFANDYCALYASQVEDFCYLTTEDGSLNSYTYYEPITKAEVVYMIVQRYYHDEYENEYIDSNYEGVTNRGDLFAKFDVDKGNYWKLYSLEACLQNHEDGLSEDLLRAMMIAQRHGIIGRITNWYEPYTRYDFLLTLTSAYEHMFTDATFPVTADMGENHIKDATKQVELGHNKEETGFNEVSKETVEDAVSLSNLKSIYGQEIDMTDEEIAKLVECSNEYDPDTNPNGYHYEIVDEYKVIKNTGDYGFLNFRYGPEVTYELMTRIPEGTEVHIIARCVETGWYRVISGQTESGEGSKKVGYQCYAYLYND